MHLARRRFPSAAAAPFSGYIENKRAPATAEDIYPAGVDDEMSSDATFLCQESEPEDELQSFIQEQSNHIFEARLREQQQQALPYCARSANFPPSFDGFPAAASFPVQRHQPPMANGVRFTPDVFQREMFRPRRGPALSWGFQQELAEYEASFQNGLGGMLYPPQPTGYVIRNDRQPLQAQPPRRSTQGGRKDGMREVPTEDSNGHKSNVQQQTKQNKSRRRGRRGGRGRKNPERTADDVPKLEKNLEDELAQEMANHISSKSALAHSFSSLRLHVAGGGTMIILNDKEITGAQPSSSIEKSRSKKGFPTEGQPVSSESFTRSEEQGSRETEVIEAAENNAKLAAWPKGCGAFFPPHLLKQVQGDTHSSNPDPSFVSQPSSPTSGLNVKAIPYSPSESTHSMDKGVIQQSRTKPGTGCFIPSYSQDPASPEMDPSHLLESVSLVESLACLENSEELLNPSHDTPTGEHELFEATDVCCADVSTPFMETVRKDPRMAEDASQIGSSTHDPGNDLIQLIENDDYTTFTSPLHLEETLDGLQAEREAREETEQKLINLQIENDELRTSLHQGEELKLQLQRMKEHNTMLQVMLFHEWNKNKKASLRRRLPIGLKSSAVEHDSPEDKSSPEEAPKEVKSVKEGRKDVHVTPPKHKRPKSAMRSSSSLLKPFETKKPLKPEKRVIKTSETVKKKELEDPKATASEGKHPTSLKSTTGASGVKKHPVRCSSHHRSVEDIGEDVRKNKKTVMHRTTTKHSRAASSSNAMRL